MYNVAIVGGTGIVGRQILEILEERHFPVKTLRLLASEKSVGEFLEFNDESIPVQLLDRDSFTDIDIAFFSATGAISEKFCPVAAATGVVCVDTSNYWSLDSAVPLVVPEVNPEAVGGYNAKRIIASPNSSTIQLALPLKALHDCSAIQRVVVSTYQSVSGSGQNGVDELKVQSGELLNGRPAKNKVYPHQIAFNCLPHIGQLLDNGYTDEEIAVVDETRKIFADETLRITTTAVRVPVFYGNCASVNVETAEKINAAKARELFELFPNIQLVDNVADHEYPMSIDAVGHDLTYVGRIREDESIANGLNLWVVSDNIRKGAATNAVQIAELLIDKYLRALPS
ncbi:MAG: aspartate-semialdehyde dehydrogenase [Thermodesulfobacteriota bacterium]|nr:aspartate-semialdehyde dehydrogenase [Thermodesulfobacteriota bacterium]